MDLTYNVCWRAAVKLGTNHIWVVGHQYVLRIGVARMQFWQHQGDRVYPRLLYTVTIISIKYFGQSYLLFS